MADKQKEIVEMEDGTKIELAETATKTRSIARKEARDMMIFVAEHVRGFQTEQIIIPIVELLNEYIHWLYDPTGKHLSPTEMMKMAIKEQKENEQLMQTDLGGAERDLDWPGDISDQDLADYNREDKKTDA